MPFEDEALKLLGRKPRVPFEVVTRCGDGSPQVLKTDPVFVEDGVWKPFPTYLWLVCPRLKRLVGAFETEGLARIYSQRLKQDEIFRKSYLEGHKLMTADRVRLAREKVGGAQPPHIEQVLSTASIAGSRAIEGVKCLHAHVAQELAMGNNPIGAEILVTTGRCNTETACVNE